MPPRLQVGVQSSLTKPVWREKFPKWIFSFFVACGVQDKSLSSRLGFLRGHYNFHAGRQDDHCLSSNFLERNWVCLRFEVFNGQCEKFEATVRQYACGFAIRVLSAADYYITCRSTRPGSMDRVGQNLSDFPWPARKKMNGKP